MLSDPSRKLYHDRLTADAGISDKNDRKRIRKAVNRAAWKYRFQENNEQRNNNT